MASATLKTFETKTETDNPVYVELYWDKHEHFCVQVIHGEPSKNYPSYKRVFGRKIFAAIKDYQKQVNAHTVKGIARTETTTSWFDNSVADAKNPESAHQYQ